MSSHQQTENARPAPASAAQSTCCIEGHQFTPSCDPECRKACYQKLGCDLVRHTDLALQGLTEAERTRPAPSLLFKRLKYILHCLLGAVAGYGLLLQLWQVVLRLREAAQQDPRITEGHIMVRLPGWKDGKSLPMYFDVTDEPPHGG